VPGVRSAHRFVRVQAPVPSSSSGPPRVSLPPKYLVAYDLDDPAVVRSDAWMHLTREVDPWSERITSHMRNTARGAYQHLRSFVDE
jgi:hypothetical protein